MLELLICGRFEAQGKFYLLLHLDDGQGHFEVEKEVYRGITVGGTVIVDQELNRGHVGSKIEVKW